MQYTQNVCIFSLENRNTSESRENHKTVDMKVTLLKLTRQKGGQSVLMATKGLAGVRHQSKVECLLGSGAKLKSLATVLWRQTRGLRFERGSERGRRNEKGLRA